jgi:methylglyoxal synthase
MPEPKQIAFITTPEYRKNHEQLVREFVLRHLYPLCKWFKVLSTGRTYDHVMKSIVNPQEQKDLHNQDDLSMIAESMNIDLPLEDKDIMRWRDTINKGLVKNSQSIKGMIELAYELVEKRLYAIIHLTDWADVSGKPDSMVLRREANVHDVPIASDIHSAAAAIKNWSSKIATDGIKKVFKPRDELELHKSPIYGINPENNVIALIAHDQMKLEMCCLVVEHASKIYNDFDFILATGTTGKWIKKFSEARGIPQRLVEDKVRCCSSGPHGGDVQIAAAVMQERCRKVIFLQDPFTSHAHETDIRLFEQSVLLFERAVQKGIELEFATNIASAKHILGV